MACNAFFSFCWLTAHNRHFGGKFIVTHAKISNAPLQSALNLALPLAHSGSLSLVLSGAHQSLLGSPRRGRVATVYPSLYVWRVKFSGQKLCRMWLILHGVVKCQCQSISETHTLLTSIHGSACLC